MKLNRSNAIVLVLLVCGVLFFGFLRDFLFVNINAQLKQNSSEKFISAFSNKQLLVVKWTLTIVFTLVYFLISYVAIKVIFSDVFLIKITTVVYAFLFALSMLAMGVGYIYGPLSEKSYEFSRYLMGMAQSPIVIMILIPAFKLVKMNDGR